LYSALKIIKKNAEGMMAKGDFAGAQKIIFRLQAPLNSFLTGSWLWLKTKRPVLTAWLCWLRFSL